MFRAVSEPQKTFRTATGKIWSATDFFPMTLMPDPKDDPRPEEPVEPDLNECCGNGCTPCVFDTYADERRRWQDAAKAWDLRHPATGQTGAGS